MRKGVHSTLVNCEFTSQTKLDDPFGSEEEVCKDGEAKGAQQVPGLYISSLSLGACHAVATVRLHSSCISRAQLFEDNWENCLLEIKNDEVGDGKECNNRGCSFSKNIVVTEGSSWN